MAFAHPAALFLLGFIPLVLLLHSLKPKLRRVTVSDLLFWKQIVDEPRGGIRLGRLLRSLSLLLQMLIIVLAALAMARPVWHHQGRPSGDIIIVLDAGASMKTRIGPRRANGSDAHGDGNTRFTMAKAKALETISALKKGARAMVIRSGPRPIVLSGFTDDKSRLAEVVGAAQADDVAGGLRDTLQFAVSFIHPGREDWVYFFTDGAGGQAADLAALHPRIIPKLIGGGSRNVAITRFAARPQPDMAAGLEIMLEITSYLPHPVVCPIQVRLRDRIIMQREVGLDALEQKLVTFSDTGAADGRLVATLDLEDDLPTDNSAYLVVHSGRKIRVLLVTPGNYFLEKVLTAFPDVQFNSLPAIVASSWDEQVARNDIIILDRVTPPPADRGNFLLIDTAAPFMPLTVSGYVERPEVVDWRRDNPLMAGLDLRGLYVQRALQVDENVALTPVAAARTTGLIYAYETNALRVAFLGFDLSESDLPLRVAFPILMANIWEWMAPGSLRFSTNQVLTGVPFPIDALPMTRKLAVRPPAGGWEHFDLAGHALLYEHTGQAGIYTIAEGDRWRYFAANLTDAVESDIRPIQWDAIAHRDASTQWSRTVPMTTEFWPLLLVVAALALLVEWGLWRYRESPVAPTGIAFGGIHRKEHRPVEAG